MKWFRRGKQKKQQREERLKKKLAKTSLEYTELLKVQAAVENEMLGEAFDLDRKRKRSYIS